MLGGKQMSNESGQGALKFAAGDVVQLMSGGPNMTIKSPRPDDSPNRQWTCIWFSGDELKEKNLPEAALRKISSN